MDEEAFFQWMALEYQTRYRNRITVGEALRLLSRKNLLDVRV